MGFYTLKMVFISFVVGFSHWVHGQTQSLRSEVDQNLTIRNWSLSPLTDNIKGIYANPLTEHLTDLLMKTKSFNFQKTETTPQAPESFEQSSAAAAAWLKSANVDAFWTGRITQGPQGLTLRLLLFQGANGQLLATETAGPKPINSIDEAKLELTNLYNTLLGRLPYQGVVLSRQGERVTISIGRNNGLQIGDRLSVVLFLASERHPLHQFLTHTEFEILGTLRLTQVDEHISFAQVIFEKIPNAVGVNAKVFARDPTKYPDSVPGLFQAEQQTPGDPLKSPSGDHSPKNGEASLLLGFGDYSHSQSLTSGGQPNSKKALSPSVHGSVDMWISTQWLATFDMTQTVASLKNSLNGSAPSELLAQTQVMRILGGYRFLTAGRFDGPQFKLLLGWTQSQSKIADSSPRAFTSETYSGLTLGLAGKTPLSAIPGESRWSMGAELLYVMSPSRSEAPVTSAQSASSNLSQFNLFADYELNPKTTLRAKLDFFQANATLSGSGTRTPGATSASVSRNTLFGGVVFRF